MGNSLWQGCLCVTCRVLRFASSRSLLQLFQETVVLLEQQLRLGCHQQQTPQRTLCHNWRTVAHRGRRPSCCLPPSPWMGLGPRWRGRPPTPSACRSAAAAHCALRPRYAKPANTQLVTASSWRQGNRRVVRTSCRLSLAMSSSSFCDLALACRETVLARLFQRDARRRFGSPRQPAAPPLAAAA